MIAFVLAVSAISHHLVSFAEFIIPKIDNITAAALIGGGVLCLIRLPIRQTAISVCLAIVVFSFAI